MLREPEVDTIATRYERERDRYEKLASVVAATLSGELRAAGIRHVPTSRAKEPDSLRLKLKYGDFSGLADFEPEFTPTILDLAGVRILLYDRDDEDATCQMVERLFVIPPNERCRKDYVEGHGYRARHRVVELAASMIRGNQSYRNLQGVWCEVQVVTLSDHVWNELEHDIRYKTPRGSPSNEQVALLGSLRGEVDALCSTVALLVDATIRREAENLAPILTPDDLSFALRGRTGRRVTGNHYDLLRLLEGVLPPLTRAVLDRLPLSPDDLDGARRRMGNAGIGQGDTYDVGPVIVALWDDLGPEFVRIAHRWVGRPGPVARLLQRLEAAAQQGKI